MRVGRHRVDADTRRESVVAICVGAVVEMSRLDIPVQ
jgi:hypothetical protein